MVHGWRAKSIVSTNSMAQIIKSRQAWIYNHKVSEYISASKHAAL